jgi:hypothetical protein
MSRLNLPVTVAAAALLIALDAACAAAQSVAPRAAPPGPASPQPRGAFVLSAGADGLGRDFGDAAPGIAAHAGYERRIGGARSPFALRLAGDYWRAGRTFTAYDQLDNMRPLDVRRTTTIVGGSLLGVVRVPALGAVRPYALAGVGVQQYANRNETDWVPFDSRSASKVVYLPAVRANTMSYTGGVGASARVGRVVPFAEARITVLPGLGDLRVQQVRAPLTLGVRF